MIVKMRSFSPVFGPSIFSWALSALILALVAQAALARFYVPIAPIATKHHTQRVCPPLPEDLGPFALRSSASRPANEVASLEEAIEAATDPSTGIVTFVSGNKAMNPMSLNFALSNRCLPRKGFPYMHVPLDEAGRLELRTISSAFPVIFHDQEAERRFSSSESLDGKSEFKAMARYKWVFAERVLRHQLAKQSSSSSSKARPLLWFDPDIALYRNPLHYLANLPECDITTQAEICALDLLLPADDGPTPDRNAEALRRVLGSAGTLARLWPKRSVMYNTGVVLLRPTNNSVALVSRILAHFEAELAAGRELDDQVSFVRMMDGEYYLEEALESDNDADEAVDSAGASGQNIDPQTLWADEHGYKRTLAAIRRNMLRGRCNTFVHKADPSIRFTHWLLHPLLFPLRPSEELTHAYSHLLLESPYLKHYNWLVGATGKVQEMLASGDWLVPSHIAEVPQRAQLTFAGSLS